MRYLAADGTVFDDVDECEEYESRLCLANILKTSVGSAHFNQVAEAIDALSDPHDFWQDLNAVWRHINGDVVDG